MELAQLSQIIEAALLAEGQPLNLKQLAALFDQTDGVTRTEIRQALERLQQDCAERGIELKEVASGYRLQVRASVQDWIARLWQQRPPRYSRAILETLALIAYRQPITRGEIEQVRGVAVSSQMIRSLLERQWIRVVGHRDVPGKPSLFATTNQFLDYFNLRSLDELPSLAELRDIDSITPELWADSPATQATLLPETEAEAEAEAEATVSVRTDESENRASD